MYNINKKCYLFLLTIMVTSLISCKKEFLEVEPKGALIASATKDYEALLNTTRIAASTAAAFLGDEVAAQSEFFSGATVYRQRLFEYREDALLVDQLPELNYLQPNYAFNKIIHEVDNSKDGSDKEKAQIKAEARVGRAFCHLLFVNDFGQPYNETTASSDLGVPIISQADVTVGDYKRATVQEVYDFIIKDINEALPDLRSFTNSGKLSDASAEALLARVYLYMHKYTEARSHLDKAFVALESSPRTAELYDYNVVLGTRGAWLPIQPNAFGPQRMPSGSTGNDFECIFNIDLSSFNITSANAFVSTPEVGALYNTSDLRLKIYSNVEIFRTATFPLNMRRLPRFSSEVGISLPDMYLMRAELKARDNDLMGAKADVEILRVKRMPASSATVPMSAANNKQTMVKYILEERIREFALKGMRWYDMRRLYTDQDFKNTLKFTHYLYDSDGEVVESYPLDPKRLTLKFGRKLLSQHPLLVENP